MPSALLPSAPRPLPEGGRPRRAPTIGAVPGDLLVCHLGRVAYRDALALQDALRRRVQAGELGDVLLLLEHPPIYTLGRRSEAGRPADGRTSTASGASRSCARTAAAS